MWYFIVRNINTLRREFNVKNRKKEVYYRFRCRFGQVFDSQRWGDGKR